MNQVDQKKEMRGLLTLLINDLSWLAYSEYVVENHKKELTRMLKVTGLIASVLKDEVVNSKQVAELLYDEEISAGLLNLDLFD